MAGLYSYFDILELYKFCFFSSLSVQINVDCTARGNLSSDLNNAWN